MSSTLPQITQMSNFILQEASEKANEIRLKTEHDFNLEKQSLIHTSKLKVLDDLSKREKEREVKGRIEQSTLIGSSRVERMKFREGLLNTLNTEATNRLALVSTDSNYSSLLGKLIVQSLIKIEENDVKLYCRKRDLKAVEKVLPASIKEYTALMQKVSSCNIVPTVKIDQSIWLEESTCGGVVLTALDGKLVCDNTMVSRLRIVSMELEPAVRETLFPMAEATVTN